jgi:S1-C subfamily serine protease
MEKLVGFKTAIILPMVHLRVIPLAIPVSLVQKVMKELKENGTLERVGSLGLEVHEIA